MVTISVYALYNVAKQREDTKRFTDGSYASWFLYVQTCTIGNIRHEIPITTLQEEAEYCNQTAPNSQVGYYVYDFNIRRSVYIDDSFMNTLATHNILSFPSSFYQSVKSGTNEFNTITPLDRFTEFDISCEEVKNSLTCMVNGETHKIKRSQGLDLFIPQGMVQGPDWYKLLKPGFFPHT